MALIPLALGLLALLAVVILFARVSLAVRRADRTQKRAAAAGRQLSRRDRHSLLRT